MGRPGHCWLADTLHGSFNTATNALWETIKIEPFDDADSSEFGMDPSKMGLEQLLAIGITDSAVNSGETGCIPDGGGSGGTGGTVPGRESPNTILGLKGNMYKHTSQQLFCDSPKQPDQKPQIRHDCMWAGMCADQSHPEKHSAGRVGCNCLQQRVEQTLDLMLMPGKSYYKAVKIEGQPNGGAVDTARSAGALRPQSYPVSPPVKSVLFKPVQSSAELPAGSSLLKRQNQLSVLPIQGYKQLPPSPPSSSECATSSAVEAGWEGRGLDPRTVVRVPHIPRGSFLSVSEQELRSITAQNHARPDTPLSLEEDPLEFKHNLNLLTATCTMGSNQQRLLPNAYSSLSSAVATGTAEVSHSSVNGNTINNTTPTSATNSSCSSATMTGTESRTSGGFGGRLGGNCSCGNSIGGVSCHTPQCYYNYLQDDTPTSVEDLRNRLMLIDDLNTLPELSTHHHLHHHHHHQVRPDSPDSSLRQLLSDLREIECSSESRSYLLDDQPTSSPTAAGVLAKDGSLQFSLHPQQQQQHQHQQQQQQQQQGLRHQSSLAPCGGGMSGGAHIACNKECCWSSLELSHLASPGNERKRRNHQFAYRRRSITARGLISDDDEDEEDDLMKQFAEEDDDFDKHFEQIAPGNLHYTHAPLSEDEEEDEEEDEDESEEEEEEEDEEKETREEDEDEEEEEDEDEDEDVQNESMYGSRSRSRNRTSRHRYHNQYRRTPARASYRPYEVDAYSNGKVPKMPASNLLANGAVNTIIAGSGASSLKSSLLGSRTGANCTGGNNAGTAVASATAQQPTGTANNSYQATHFGDHSYTRPKGGYNMNELGVQTPSDSGEFCLDIIIAYYGIFQKKRLHLLRHEKQKT
uniref:Uncharacterized protein n=1 Tax=Anopheles minimus TaxID=112268 RepID=A0A182W5W4_9DIPT